MYVQFNARNLGSTIHASDGVLARAAIEYECRYRSGRTQAGR